MVQPAERAGAGRHPEREDLRTRRGRRLSDVRAISGPYRRIGVDVSDGTDPDGVTPSPTSASSRSGNVRVVSA